MGAGAIGQHLNMSRTRAACRPLAGPLRDRVEGEEIISIHPDAGHIVAQTTSGEVRTSTGEVGVGGDGPLVVDDVQNHWRLEDAGEVESVVIIALCRSAVADPSDAAFVQTLVLRGHCDADSLAELGCNRARYGDVAACAITVVNRHLSS